MFFTLAPDWAQPTAASKAVMQFRSSIFGTDHLANPPPSSMMALNQSTSATISVAAATL